MRKKITRILCGLVLTSSCAFAQIPTNGLVGYWPFNGDAKDMSGNGNDAAEISGGVSFVDGKYGKAAKFNGISDPGFIRIANSTSLQFFKEATIAFWCRIDNTYGMDGWGSPSNNGRHCVLAKDHDRDGSLCIWTHISAENKFYTWGGPRNGGGGSTSRSTQNSTGSWVQIAYVFDTAKCQVYVNGLLDSTFTHTGIDFSSTNSHDLFIGKFSDYWYPLDGAVDEMRIYNKTISETEIQALYHEGETDLNKGLVAYYPFNGNAKDESGNGNDGTVNGNVSLTTDRFGKINSAYSFPGAAFNNIIVSHSESLALDTMTLNAWIYSETSYGYGQIIQKNRDIVSGHYGLYTSGISGTVSYGVGVGAGTTKEPSFGSWHLISGSIAGNHAKFYVDGQLILDTIAPNIFPYSGSDPLSIGMHYYSGVPDFWTYPFLGKIDDVRIYNRVLTNDEIRLLYDIKTVPQIISHRLDAIGTKTDINKTVEIPVSIDSIAATEKIIAYQFDVAYDSTVLQYTGKTKTSTLSENGSVLVNEVSAGHLAVSYMSSNALVGKGIILKLQFNTKAYDTTLITLSNAFLNDKPVVDIQNATIIITDTTKPTAKITISPAVGTQHYGDTIVITATLSEAIAKDSLIKINLSGVITEQGTMTRITDTTFTYSYILPVKSGDITISLSNGTDKAGNSIVSTPTAGGSFTIEALLYGDANDDKKVQAYDAALTLQYSVGLDPLPTLDPLPWAVWRMNQVDVDTLNGVTANDAALILQYSARIINSFPANNKLKSDNADNADVTITQESNNLVFRSTGKMIGVNISVTDNKSVLGAPVVLNKDMISAINITDSQYAIGLATAYSPADGEAFLSIPLKTKEVTPIAFQLTINTTSSLKSVTISDNATSITAPDASVLFVYPNPVTDNLHVALPAGFENSIAQIFNSEGKEMYSSSLQNASIDVSNFASGVYVLQLIGNNKTVNQQFLKK